MAEYLQREEGAAVIAGRSTSLEADTWMGRRRQSERRFGEASEHWLCIVLGPRQTSVSRTYHCCQANRRGSLTQVRCLPRGGHADDATFESFPVWHIAEPKLPGLHVRSKTDCSKVCAQSAALQRLQAGTGMQSQLIGKILAWMELQSCTKV